MIIGGDKIKAKLVLLPEQMMKEIEELIEKGYFNTSNEFIRYAIRIVIDKYKKN